MQKWSINSFVKYLESGYTMIGQDVQINNIAPIDEGVTTDISFCTSVGKEGLESILSSKSGIILCKKSLEGDIKRRIDYCTGISKLYVFVNNPRLVFIRIAKVIKYYSDIRKGISSHAIVSDSAKIGRNCYVGDYSIIGDDCTIGDNTIIDSRVVVKNAIIGNNCILQTGSVIGETVFAFERVDKDLSLEIFPHFGKVIIKNNVEIFANCSIARGTISDTIIEEGTKIDALCHIAQNAHIGKNSQLTAGTIVGEGAHIGNHCWLGLNSTLKHKIRIGNKVIVGSGSSVIDDVQDNEIVAGSPAKSIKHRISISSDKLFLMGGQIDDTNHRSNNHKLSNSADFIKRKGFTIVGIFFGALLI